MFPADVTLESVAATAGSCTSDATECQLGDMASGDVIAITLTFRTTNSQKMDFQGQVTQSTVDPDLTNNFVLKKFGGSLGMLLLPLLGLWWSRLRMKRTLTQMASK